MESDSSLRAELKNTINAKHVVKIGELARLVGVGTSVDEDDFIDELEALADQGAIELKEPTYEAKSMFEYLSEPNLSGWFWCSMALTVAAVLTIALVPNVFPVNIFRWLIASAFVLYMPGYCLLQFLFSRKGDFDGIDRILFNIGLSLVVISMVGLILNFLPWGIELVPITVALTIFVVLFTLLAALRKYSSIRGMRR